MSSKIKQKFIDDEPPEKKLRSEGDILIKELLKKQTSTDTSLQKELSKGISFTHSVEIPPLPSTSKGKQTLDEITSLHEKSQEICKLKSIGLIDKDIEFYFDYKENGFDGLAQKHKLLSERDVECKINFIKQQIRLHLDQEKYKNEPKIINGHKKDFLVIKPDSTETKLLKFALENEAPKEKLPDPMNEIIDVEKDFMSHIDNRTLPISVKKIQKRARNLSKQVLNMQCPIEAPQKLLDVSKTSLWDKKEHTPIINSLKSNEKKIYTCKPQKFYTITEGKIVELKSNLQETSNFTNNTRMTLEEIKEIPKFKDYTIGLPSKVLYFKNLASSVRQADLESIFEEYLSDIISIRIMQGKMKGQAFIEFQNEIKAELALNNLNGMIVKNKPMIIQYGKGGTNRITKTS